MTYRSPRLTRRLFVGHGLVSLAALVACSSEESAGSGGSAGKGGAGGSGGAAGSGGAGGSGGSGGGYGVVPPGPELESLISEIGPLGDPDANGLRLPPGFTSRLVAHTGEKPVSTSDYEWHFLPDGGATYLQEDGGWIYVSNSELPFTGGVGALRFNQAGELVDAYSILSGSSVNCAGGKTPWGSWLSCEEISRGKVFECDPRGILPAVERPALGIFKHEAAAVDPVNQHIYLTEDESDGCFYRFIPDRLTASGFADLTSGKLQVASVDGERVTWLDVPDPQFTGSVGTRNQVAAATRFRGGEGIWEHAGVIYFSTKSDHRVWAYTIETETLRVLYDRATHPTPFLSGVDNLTVSASGDVLVAEDGDDMEIVAILPDGSLKSLVQVMGHDGSEVTGPAFDPSGTRLYFSSQRGAKNQAGDGHTFEVTGPFHRLKA
ncbi:MAG: DUF839 domain-containing protein [Polyangiaceae bacterium]|nr:DUF839 domain-containing protein [Polyangiaceae bacterium]MCW5789627.1 DUF839 domain-containing protein [Polyangiaceae bacterium]